MTLGKDKVILERVPAPLTTTEAGLKIPDSARERPDVGKVLEVGSEVKDWKANDVVLFPRWSGFAVNIPGDVRDLLVLFSDEIWLAL